MKLLPTKELKFKLVTNQVETLNILNRRTEKSENLTSQYTDKSFRGIIEGNKFKLISSTIGKGAFCVLSGSINPNEGIVKVEIHEVFKVFLSIILLLPLIGFVGMTITGTKEFSPIMFLIVIGQMFMIRFIFIELAFRFLSRNSLNKLRDVLDVEWTKN